MLCYRSLIGTEGRGSIGGIQGFFKGSENTDSCSGEYMCAGFRPFRRSEEGIPEWSETMTKEPKPGLGWSCG